MAFFRRISLTAFFVVILVLLCSAVLAQGREVSGYFVVGTSQDNDNATGIDGSAGSQSAGSGDSGLGMLTGSVVGAKDGNNKEPGLISRAWSRIISFLEGIF